MIKFDCFIFDVDATLVDTETVIDNIWKTWAKGVGIDFSLVQQHIHGRKIEETLRCVNSVLANDEQILAVKSIAVNEMKKATAIPGALEFVSKLDQGSWAIATSGPRKIASTSLHAAGFELPRVMVCAEEVSKGKPEPEPFLVAAKMLNVSPEQCVAFEDSPVGIKSAKTAGCYTIALLTSHRAVDLAEADLIVEGFDSLTLSKVEDKYCLAIRSNI